jgi:hypothetical protein
VFLTDWGGNLVGRILIAILTEAFVSLDYEERVPIGSTTMSDIF